MTWNSYTWCSAWCSQWLRICIRTFCQMHGRPNFLSPIRGQIEPCDANISKKCLCSHHNNTALIKTNIPVYSLSHDKYLKFQFKIKRLYFLPLSKAKQRHGSKCPPPLKYNLGELYPNMIRIIGLNNPLE